ncbi:hypothetical protein H5410_015399 [Solanum commersonii]|uniref:Uncharacterized protein n=1 Tax=Solanum commersonii TaxID=4109 RepID=A0A9J5ZUD4_SOLCO|nr:hypothetical protein H5410_015399 [Solanum commersonii]
MDKNARKYQNKSWKWAQNSLLERSLDRPIHSLGILPLFNAIKLQSRSYSGGMLVSPRLELTFRIHHNDWEVERVANMLNVLGVFTGTTSDPDSLRWKYTEDGILLVNRL